jgi:hypothetical protein
MLPLFRKIRYRLAKDNQFLKYFRYAIGEIVLVVIGILIALYINNWNERRKEREMFDLTLVEAQKELVKNLEQVGLSLDGYAYQDSIMKTVLVDTLAIEEYDVKENQLGLFNSGFWVSPTELSNESFKRLSQFNNINERQDSILQRLNVLQFTINNQVEELEDWMLSTMKENRASIKNYNWFNDWAYLQWENQEMRKYFQGDPEYLNIIANYSLNLHILTRFLSSYDIEGRMIYSGIHDYLKSQNLQLTDSLLFNHKPEIFEHYLGKYETVWCSDKNYIHGDSIVINREEERLMFTIYGSDGKDTRLEIIPVNKYFFRTEGGLFFYLSLENGGEVKSIRCNGGPVVLDMKKIH